MKLFSVTVENYRQYCGKISLDFSTGEQNITIIQGDNGGGKSNFMNAIVWCLFDDEMFKSKNNEGRPIINESVITSIDVKQSASVSVSVVLGEDKPEFEFIRKANYSKTSTGRIDYLGTEFKGYQIKSTGHEKIADPEWEINRRFIPKDLRGFFFFDGEKMDQYFEDTSSVKTNVERISQIDVLNNVIDTLNSTIRTIDKEMGKLSPESGELVDTLQNYQDEKNKLEMDRSELFPKNQELEDEKRKIDEYLRNNSNNLVKEKGRRRDELTRQRDAVLEQIAKSKDQMKHIISSAIPGVYALKALEFAAELIDEETNKGTLPPNVKDVFLKELLEKGVCICGRSLDEDESCRRNIEEMLERIVPSDVAYDATQGKFTIKNILSTVDFRPELKTELQKQMNLENSLKKYNADLSSISDELSNYDESEISEKESRRKTIETQIINNSTKIGSLEGRLSYVNEKISEVQEQLAQSNKDYQKYCYLEKQKQYVMMLLDEFRKIKERIINEVRLRLERKTREYFFNMIWKKNAFSDVRILDLGKKYKISVLSPNNAECLGDLSAGERQVLALSFTAALYSVSGYSVPVIIDTPLGRISGTTRDNIASALPGYLSETQLIMTMTDTEYTDSVRQSMSVAVGKEYKIQYDEDSKTSKVVII